VGLGQGEKSADFPENSDSKSKWVNLFKRFGDSVDIVQRKPGIAMQTG
jgi:hypothetical protein